LSVTLNILVTMSFWMDLGWKAIRGFLNKEATITLAITIKSFENFIVDFVKNFVVVIDIS